MAATLYSIAIFVTELPRAVEFYRDALGLPVRKQGSFGAELLEGDTHIGIHPAVHEDAKALVGRHTGITLHVPGLLHLCGQLHDRRVRFVAEPTQQSWGIMAMVADPDGNIIALWEDKLPDAETAIDDATAVAAPAQPQSVTTPAIPAEQPLSDQADGSP